MSVEFVALASAVIAAPAVMVPVPDAFVVPASAWCASASDGQQIAFGEEVVLSLWLLSQRLPLLYRPSTVEVQRWNPNLGKGSARDSA